MEQINQIYTKEEFKAQLVSLGIKEGDTLVVHTKMSSLPYIIGSERAIVESLLEILGSNGTLFMPSQNSYDNGDPKFWSMPPMEQSLHSKLREKFLPFDFFTPLKKMGKVAEYFHHLPGVKRSPQPTTSFIGRGPKAEYFLKSDANSGFSADSVVEKMTRENVKILLLGVDYDNCTVLHYAQAKSPVYMNHNKEAGLRATQTIVAETENKEIVLSRELPYGIELATSTMKIIEKGVVGYDSDIFPVIGEAYEKDGNQVQSITFGKGKLKVLPAKDLVEFGIIWLEEHYMEYRKKEPTTPHIRLKQTMNIKIYHPDWQFQNGKIIEIEDKVTLDEVEEKEFTQEEEINKPVTRKQFMYTIKHELDTKGNKIAKEQYYHIFFHITFGITKDGQVVENTEAVSEEKRDGDIYYMYSTFLVPIEQICFDTQADRNDMEHRDVQCMKTGTEQSHKGEFPYPHKKGEVGKPVTLKQGKDEFTMTLTKVIRNEEFDESFFIFEVNPKKNNQIYFEGAYYSFCGDKEICKAKSRTPEEQQKYETYYKALLEQEKVEVYRGNTLTDFEKNQPKRFVVPARGSKSKKFTFGFNTDTHANRNVYWELG